MQVSIYKVIMYERNKIIKKYVIGKKWQKETCQKYIFLEE